MAFFESCMIASLEYDRERLTIEVDESRQARHTQRGQSMELTLNATDSLPRLSRLFPPSPPPPLSRQDDLASGAIDSIPCAPPIRPARTYFYMCDLDMSTCVKVICLLFYFTSTTLVSALKRASTRTLNITLRVSRQGDGRAGV